MFNMNKNKKILLISSISLAVIIILGIVYAAFTQQLNIAGSATGRSSKWDIHFENLSNVSLNGTAKELTAPTINTNNTQISNYSVSLTSPGDYVEYTFDVVNDGDYDATLTGLQKTAPSCQGTGDNASTDATNVCGKLTYTLTYEDGTTVSQNDTLASKETKTMKLKLLYQTFDDASLLPKMDVTISGLGITLTYTQDGNAKVNADGTTPLDPYSHHVGDTFTIGTDSYHIIVDSPTDSDYVVALKDVPLTVSEVNTYGSSISVSAYNQNGYGSIKYGTAETKNNYSTSNVKTVVNAWAAGKFQNDELKTVNGYSARLISLDELVSSFGFALNSSNSTNIHYESTQVPNWLYNSNYSYWTMTAAEDSNNVWSIQTSGLLNKDSYSNAGGQFDENPVIRPVINILKTALPKTSS